MMPSPVRALEVETGSNAQALERVESARPMWSMLYGKNWAEEISRA